MCLCCNDVFDTLKCEHFKENPPVNECKSGKKIIFWVPPGIGENIINTDGSFKPKWFGEHSRNVGSCGIIWRNAEGLQEAWHTYLGQQPDAETVECLGVQEALEFAETRGLVNVKIQTDCLNVVKYLTGKKSTPADLVALVQQCKTVLQRNPSYLIEFIYRETNQVADSLAKRGLDEAYSMRWRGDDLVSQPLPENISELIYEDGKCIGRVMGDRKK